MLASNSVSATYLIYFVRFPCDFVVHPPCLSPPAVCAMIGELIVTVIFALLCFGGLDEAMLEKLMSSGVGAQAGSKSASCAHALPSQPRAYTPPTHSHARPHSEQYDSVL